MIDIIAELEYKINELLSKVDEYKVVALEEITNKNSYIHEIEEDNANLHNELESLRSNSNEKEQRINEGVDKLRNIMDRIKNTMDQPNS